MRRSKFLLGAGIALASLAIIAPSATAEPNGAPTFRALAGTGSVTTQEVLNGLSDVVTINGVKQIGSYNASPPGNIQTKASGCVFARPSGSGAGVAALQDSLEGVANPGCLDFARSSANNAASNPSNPSIPGQPGKLSYVPFAIDAVTFAVRDDSQVPTTLSVQDLTDIYNCLAVPDVQPYLPQFGSGTRQFFLQQLGFTDAANFTTLPGHTCIKQTDNQGNPLLENTGNLITDPKAVVPYSVADYQSQINRTVTDVHGRELLGLVNGVPSTVLNTNAPFKREVYNVIPTNRETVAPTSTVFVGPNSLVCQNGATIQKYGFGLDPNCGVITVRTS